MDTNFKSLGIKISKIINWDIKLDSEKIWILKIFKKLVGVFL